MDILDALTKNYLGTGEVTDDIGDIKKGPDRANYVVISSTMKRQREIYSAKIIQQAWRKYQKRKNGGGDEEEKGDDDKKTDNDKDKNNNMKKEKSGNVKSCEEGINNTNSNDSRPISDAAVFSSEPLIVQPTKTPSEDILIDI